MRQKLLASCMALLECCKVVVQWKQQFERQSHHKNSFSCIIKLVLGNKMAVMQGFFYQNEIERRKTQGKVSRVAISLIPNDVTRFSICGTLIFSSIVTMTIEILKIDREANKQDIKTTRYCYYNKETTVFLLNFRNQLKIITQVLQNRFYILIAIPVSFQVDTFVQDPLMMQTLLCLSLEIVRVPQIAAAILQVYFMTSFRIRRLIDAFYVGCTHNCVVQYNIGGYLYKLLHQFLLNTSKTLVFA